MHATRLIDRLAAPNDEMVRLLALEAAHGVAVVDADACIIRVNDAMRRLAGPSCLSAACLPELFTGAAREAAWDGLRSVLAGGGASARFAGSLPGPGGADVTLDVTCVPVREADGNVSGAVVHAFDISQQTRLEAQVAQGHRLRLVGEFTSGIAHDFNNVLMVVLNSADEVLRRGRLDADTREDLLQIRHSVGSGVTLVAQLLNTAQPQPPGLSAIPIDDHVAALARLARRLVGSAITVQVDLRAAGWCVRVDPAQIDQILLNLVVNARNAMPDGGVLRLATGTITVADGDPIGPLGQYVTVHVQDTGTGIAPDILPRIFEPFFTTRAGSGGSGLGLSTAQSIAARFDGFLRLDSTVGTGTRAGLYLPALGALEVPATQVDQRLPTRAVVHSPASTRLVLLVDDEKGARLLAARALASRGWQVLAAESGEAALAMLEADAAAQANLCIVITDFVLPGLNGVALVQAVRQMCPDVPAIMTSGHPELAVTGWMANAENAFLAKPYALRDALLLIEQRAWQAPSLDTAGITIRSREQK